MTRIEQDIETLIEILENKGKCVIEFETVGAVSIKIIFRRAEFKYLKTSGLLKIFDRVPDRVIKLDIFTANKVIIDNQVSEYMLELENGQSIKIKTYWERKRRIEKCKYKNSKNKLQN